MMQTIDIRTLQPSRSELARLVPRAITDVAAATESAAALIDDVRARGELALLEQAEKLDGVRPPHVRVYASEISEAVRHLVPQVRDALEAAIERVRTATRAQVPAGSVTVIAPGAEVIQRWQPVGRYLPHITRVFSFTFVVQGAG